jgi:undecaprenyl diphosphate synthase
MHLALIMDGNRRWAKQRNLPSKKGHEEGAKALLRAMDEADRLGIEYTTFYAFSSDNYNRESHEVGNILGIIAYFLRNFVYPKIMENGFRFRFIGELELLPNELLDIINLINKDALNNKGRMFIFAIGYGGDLEIAHAVNRCIELKSMRFDNSPISVEDIKNSLYTVNIPAPDLVIRFGGHQRLSNFMPLQTIYSELMFTDKLWPDFQTGDLDRFLQKYKEIKRNFGG